MAYERYGCVAKRTRIAFGARLLLPEIVKAPPNLLSMLSKSGGDYAGRLTATATATTSLDALTNLKHFF